MDFLIDPYRYGPRRILNAPLYADDVDIIAPAASAALQGVQTYDTDGVIMQRQELTFSPSKITYTHVKIDPTGTTDKFSLSCDIEILDTTVGGGVFGRVFGISNGVDELAFGFETAGSARPTMTPYIYDNTNVPTISGEQAPAIANYKIEWSGVDTVKWYVNNVLFYTATLERFAGSVYVSNDLYHGGTRPRYKYSDLLVFWY